MSRTVPIAAAVLLAALSLVPGFASAGDPPATPVDDAAKMGHSPASKEMEMMKRGQTAPKGVEAPAAPDNGMGHSPASKEMQMMHRGPEKHGVAPTEPEEHNMMGHSPADAKAMRGMKDKHPKTHKAPPKAPADGKPDAAPTP